MVSDFYPFQGNFLPVPAAISSKQVEQMGSALDGFPSGTAGGRSLTPQAQIAWAKRAPLALAGECESPYYAPSRYARSAQSPEFGVRLTWLAIGAIRFRAVLAWLRRNAWQV